MSAGYRPGQEKVYVGWDTHDMRVERRLWQGLGGVERKQSRGELTKTNFV